MYSLVGGLYYSSYKGFLLSVRFSWPLANASLSNVVKGYLVANGYIMVQGMK